MTPWNGRFVVMASLTLVTLAACNPADRNKEARVAAQQDSLMTQQNTVLQREKDSLMVAMRSVFEAMNSIDSANSLAGYKPSKNRPVEPLVRDEVLIRDRTLKALARLRVVEARLKTSVSNVEKLTGENKALAGDLAQFRETANALQLQLATQNARVDTLMQHLTMANSRNDSLSGDNRRLAVTVDSFGSVSRKGFVIAGTKQYLMQHSLVNEVGGSRFPFVVKVGSTLRPASAHLDTALFKPVDRMTDVIPLDANKQYEIVSAQDLDGVDRKNVKGRVFRGSIRIVNPQQFWRPSAFLILREL